MTKAGFFKSCGVVFCCVVGAVGAVGCSAGDPATSTFDGEASASAKVKFKGSVNGDFAGDGLDKVIGELGLDIGSSSGGSSSGGGTSSSGGSSSGGSSSGGSSSGGSSSGGGPTVCPSGFVLLDHICVAINTCLTNHGGCALDAICASTGAGTNTCTCKTGFVGNGLLCDVESSILTPVLATASSSLPGLPPISACDGDLAAWASGLLTGAPEWLTYDLGAPKVLTKVKAIALTDHFGVGAKIQGSVDGVTWVDIHTMALGSLNLDLPYLGYTSCEEPIVTSQAYRYVRYYSGPSLFVQLALLQFEGHVAVH